MIRRAAGGVSKVAREALVGLARAYQVTLSPLIGRNCRFVPTCSQYFIQAVRTRGCLRGTLMGLWRILRCHPFCKGGYDPVEAAAGPPRDAERAGEAVTPDPAGTGVEDGPIL